MSSVRSAGGKLSDTRVSRSAFAALGTCRPQAFPFSVGGLAHRPSPPRPRLLPSAAAAGKAFRSSLVRAVRFPPGPGSAAFHEPSISSSSVTTRLRPRRLCGARWSRPVSAVRRDRLCGRDPRAPLPPSPTCSRPPGHTFPLPFLLLLSAPSPRWVLRFIAERPRWAVSRHPRALSTPSPFPAARAPDSPARLHHCRAFLTINPTPESRQDPAPAGIPCPGRGVAPSVSHLLQLSGDTAHAHRRGWTLVLSGRLGRPDKQLRAAPPRCLVRAWSQRLQGAPGATPGLRS